jgi:hypothetical protein
MLLWLLVRLLDLDRPMPDGQVRLTYIVDGECQGCTSSTDLFDTSKSRGDSQNAGRSLQSSDKKCFCPANNPILRGPTSREFELSFDGVVNELVNEGVITTVEDAVKVLEVNNATCNPSVDAVASKVFVEFIIENPPLLPDDIAVAEQAFRDAYNDLIETFCDPLFATSSMPLLPGENLLFSHQAPYFDTLLLLMDDVEDVTRTLGSSPHVLVLYDGSERNLKKK